MQGNREGKNIGEALARLYDFLRNEHESYSERLKEYSNQLKSKEAVELAKQEKISTEEISIILKKESELARLEEISIIFTSIPSIVENLIDLEAIRTSLAKECPTEKADLEAYHAELEKSSGHGFFKALTAFYSICIALPETQQKLIAKEIVYLEQLIAQFQAHFEVLDHKFQEISQRLTEIRHQEEASLTQQEQQNTFLNASTLPDVSSFPEKAVILYLFSYPGQDVTDRQIFGHTFGGHIAIGVRNGNNWEYLSVAAQPRRVVHSLLSNVHRGFATTARYSKMGERSGVLIDYEMDSESLAAGRYEHCETLVLDCTKPISPDTSRMLTSIRAVRQEYEEQARTIAYNLYRKNCANYVVDILKSGAVDELLKACGLLMPKAWGVYAPLDIYNFFKMEFNSVSNRLNFEHQLAYGEKLSPGAHYQEAFAKASSDLAQLSPISMEHFNQFKSCNDHALRIEYAVRLELLEDAIKVKLKVSSEKIISLIQLTVLFFAQDFQVFSNEEPQNEFVSEIEFRLLAIMDDLNHLYSKAEIKNKKEDEKVQQAFAILKNLQHSLQYPFAYTANRFLQNEYSSLILLRLHGIFAQEVAQQNCDDCLIDLIEKESSSKANQTISIKGKEHDEGDGDSREGFTTSEDYIAYLSNFWEGRQPSSLEMLFSSVGLHTPFFRSYEASLMNRREYEADAAMDEFPILRMASKQYIDAHRELINQYGFLSQDQKNLAFNQIQTVLTWLIYLNQTVTSSTSVGESAEHVLFKHYLHLKYTMAEIQKCQQHEENLLSEAFYQNIINELNQIAGKINQKLYLEQTITTSGNDWLNLTRPMQRILFPEELNKEDVADYSSLRNKVITSLISHDPMIYTHAPTDSRGKIITPKKIPSILSFWRWRERFELQELTVKHKIEKIINHSELSLVARVVHIGHLINNNAPGSLTRLFRKEAYQRYQEMAKQAVLICVFDEFVHGTDIAKLYHFLQLQAERMPQYKQELTNFSERVKDAYIKVIVQYELFQKREQAKPVGEETTPSTAKKMATPPSLAQTLSGLKPLPIQGAFFGWLMSDIRRKRRINKKIAQVRDDANRVLESEATIPEEQLEIQVRKLIEDDFALQRDLVLDR